jgi:hypothetical protein
VRNNYGLGKTFSSASEAFRDATYATAFWRCESENEYAWRYIKELFLVCLFIGVALFAAYLMAFPLLDQLTQIIKTK